MSTRIGHDSMYGVNVFPYYLLLEMISDNIYIHDEKRKTKTLYLSIIFICV
jgi:hypothetical protein